MRKGYNFGDNCYISDNFTSSSSNKAEQIKESTNSAFEKVLSTQN